jgi:tetratricopeptide (TPR) repeat protein
MNARFTFTALASAVFIGAGATSVQAQSSAAVPASVYQEPQIVKLGTSATPPAGKGTVVVQVLVSADGTFAVQRVIKSSNPGDDAAALAIAKTSKYRPATNHGKPQTAFKDFTLNFSNSGAAVAGASSDVDRLEAMFRPGNSAGTKSTARAYLAAHPADSRAPAVLGAADAFTGDNAGAAAAFDKVEPVPPVYLNLAAQAYQANAASLSDAKQYEAAIASAHRSIVLVPTVGGYNALGIAELGKGDATSAVRDLEQATALAVAGAKVPAATRATILGNLAAAYAAAGAFDKAKETVAQAQQVDPHSLAGDGVANVLAERASQEGETKNYAAAAADYTLAAEFSPANASALYTNASFAYLRMVPKPESEKARAAASKALAADPKNASAAFALGVGFANDGKKDDATKALNAALAQAQAANQAALADKIKEALKQVEGMH